MNKKYFCPRRPEKTPSAHAYGDHFFCFGCGARGSIKELGLEPGERLETVYVEDVSSTISYIDTLSRKTIRGFSLPFNDRGYYLVYPCRTFYKFRIESASSGSKYRGPSGHSKPWFTVVDSMQETVAIVEGEFNALSLGLLEGPFDIVSPGGAGDFYSKSAQANLRKYANYGRAEIICDADAAGAQAAIETKAKLITIGCPEVRIHLVERDFNDILVQDGKEALREEVKRMGLY